MGCRVSATDAKDASRLPDVERLRDASVQLDLGGHDPGLFSAADLVVVSPGVPPLDVLDVAERRGVPLISEVELAFLCSRAEVVGITGSNGKSTVTTMTGSILSRSSRPAFTGGNLGTAPSVAVGSEADVDGGIFVLELSSFQLERVRSFRCEAATVLNVSPDHMDRYRDLDHYASAKGNVFVNQGDGDHAVVLSSEETAVELARPSSAALHLVGQEGTELFLEDGTLHVQLSGLPAATFDAGELGLKDPLSVKNGIVAVALSMLCGADERAVREGLEAFRPLAHRFELVAHRQGVRWINDSKATNPAAVVAALQACTPPVILIAGGLDKKLDYSEILPAAHGRLKHVLLVGQAAGVMAETLQRAAPTTDVGTLQKAVERASSLARPGDTVLLSPACASFDQFRSFEHRGDLFRALVLDQ